jgi:hypothetical protein
VSNPGILIWIRSGSGLDPVWIRSGSGLDPVWILKEESTRRTLREGAVKFHFPTHYFRLIALCTMLRFSLSLCPPKTNLALYTSSPLSCRVIVRTNLTGTIFGLPPISERSTNFKVPLLNSPSNSFRFALSNRLLHGSRGDMISVSKIWGLSTKGSW